MKIAVTGKITGRLSGELIRRGYYHLDCDLTNENSIRESIEKVKPDLIINCAAYTNVDKSESERILAYNINSFGPKRLAENFKGQIIQISTDYVFDGEKKEELGYRENDICNPLSGYGFSKYLGEVALRMYMNRCMIVRTTILYEYNKNKINFVQSVYDNLKNKKSVQVPNELYGNPTYIPHLVNQLEYAIENWIPGIINLAGTDNLSRYDLAKRVAKEFGFDEKLVKNGPVKGDAKRGLRTGLIMDKANRLSYPMYDLSQGLEDFRKQVNNG